MSSQQMISTHPKVRGNYSAAVVRCIDECYACVQACTVCADACLAESMVEHLRQCIRLNLDCADLCQAVATIASRSTGSNEEVLRHALETCCIACGRCAKECESHASAHEHCRICAKECRECEDACRLAIRIVAAGGAPRLHAN